MNRVIAAIATATTATMAAAAAIAPAMAASHPATDLPAKHASASKTVAQHAKITNPAPTMIGSELDGDKYVTIVRCQGVDSPPPVTLGRPGTPLTVHGGGLSAAILKAYKKADPYKTIYTCTVTVAMKLPTKPKAKPSCEIPGDSGRKGCTKHVALHTGFGGLAPQVRDHHPAG